ncbi:YfhO family protein [Mucilaginibacter flavus]|uniref:YfhO family protein n=1 Tax=Mucilaginibacter flavus TaxID=931504 RepID=UPI0025B46860|nr:YfhO family protein [Mucilaginibacter flavus]MDN3579620.1 YfhO family protein [Mucilaginibacter flavus]
MNNWFKRNSVHLIIVAILVAISFAYFFSPLIQGKALIQSDVLQAQSMQKEINDVKAATGKAPLWTNQMFGGMPAYQIWAAFPSNITSHVINILKAVFPNPVDTVLLYLLGAYLLFSVLKLKPWLAAAGAIAFAFSSYNFIYITAGHANQAYAIAFFAPILAGIILTLRGKYLLGGSITAFALAMEIRSNHVQMTYYLLLAIAILLGIELYHAIKDKQTKPFLKATAYLVGAVLLAIAVNASILWTTYEYSQYTIRGKANLTSKGTAGPNHGLDKDYAYTWSQSVGECLTFLVPNAYGGGTSTVVGDDSKAVKILTDAGVDPGQANGFVSQQLYFGNKPSTFGPWYFGAAVFFLFVLGLLIVKNRIKWWIVGAVLLSMFLSFGKNLPFLSDFFFNYVPMYNKFRAVESTLVIAAFCFPILALLAVNEVITSTDRALIFKRGKIAFFITGGLLLLLIAIPDAILSFKTDDNLGFIANLTQMFKGNSEMANKVASSLVDDRISLERADAIRSLIFVLLTTGLLWLIVKEKIKANMAAWILAAIILFDMWGVDKRYLKDTNFVDKSELAQQYTPREVDEFIMKDSDPNFRVFDMSGGDPFHDSHSSYFYKTVGGFHSARLRRFDELIENQFSKSVNQDVLDMLNTKYIITADPKTGNAAMRTNQTACGNAWFVKSVKFADNADQEMQAISSFSPKDEAIVDKQYKSFTDGQTVGSDPASTIKLTSYAPEHLVYQSGSTATQIAVFSEIYYDKGWTMTIDGKESPYFRADYLLRAAVIPVGNHKIEFTFHPTSYYAGENISLAGSLLLVLALGGAAYTENKKKPAVKPAGKKA